MANETVQRGGANIWLALIAGLAVGFAVGQQVGFKSNRPEAEPAKVAAAGAAPTGSYKTESQFPTKWLKSSDLTSVSGVSFDGMSEGQKVLAMQVLNERHCECGCNMDSIADCAKKDPNCPRSPKLVKDVVAMAKQGKGLSDLYAYLDKENGKAAAAAPAAPAGPKKVPIPAGSPRHGPKAAKVTIVEFSDFQCPFCGRVTPTVKEIEQKYPKDVAVVFVNQPLPFHDKAQGAAQAFLAAHRQGKAWEMHDKMFANQQALAPADLDKYAQEIGLNVARFKKDFDDPKIKEQIKSDQALANSVGANGTPTFMINGREVVGAQPFAAFQTVIDEEIKKADALLKSGTKIEDVYTKLMEQAAAAPPPAPAAAAPPPPAEKQDISVGDAPVKGPKNAPVTIVEWSDFQCPFCGRVIPTVKQIEDTYKGKVRLAFKHQPLPFHNNAEPAAEAAMAANEQGKFWEMHDKLFANQQNLDRPSLEKYAQEIGLNMSRFKAALDASKFKERIQKDSAEGMKVGANGTPTFFINGQKVEGAQPFENFKAVIDKELAAKK